MLEGTIHHHGCLLINHDLNSLSNIHIIPTNNMMVFTCYALSFTFKMIFIATVFNNLIRP